jgi:pilus assembly protein CpaE
MNQLKIGLVIAGQELSNEVQGCLKALPVRVLLQQDAVGDVTAFLDQIDQLRLDVLVLDLVRLAEPFETLIRRVRSCASAPLVIALNDRADPEIILGAIRAGANEFLYPPLEAGLLKALERLSAEREKMQPPPARHVGKTLGFVSAKGGCGATTIACHVAVEIQKLTAQEVLLADLDLDAGLVGFLMNSKSSYTIMDAVRNVNRLDASYWKALVSNGHAGVEVISAPPPAVAREAPNGDQMREVIRFMRSSYDWIVTDLGRSLSQLTAAIFQEIDETYVIATLDLPTLNQARHLIQSLLDTGYSRNRLRLILNRMPKRPDFEPGQIQKVLGVPIFEMLPNSYPELFEAYSERNLLPAATELAKSLNGLAGRISGVQPAKEKGKGKLNLSFF